MHVLRMGKLKHEDHLAFSVLTAHLQRGLYNDMFVCPFNTGVHSLYEGVQIKGSVPSNSQESLGQSPEPQKPRVHARFNMVEQETVLPFAALGNFWQDS